MSAGEGLRDALKAIMVASRIDTPRVKELTQKLGVDKSTASRIVRGVRATGIEEALREFPALAGLMKFIEACVLRGAESGVVERAKQAANAFEETLRAFPGGRGGLMTALAESIPLGAGMNLAGEKAARPSEERAARRAAFNAATYLQGIWLEGSIHGMFIGPGSRPGKLDQALVNAVVGMKRLRSGPPVTVGGLYGSPLTQGLPTRVTLDGAPILDDARVVFLREFCDGPVDRVHVEKRDRSFLLWLDREDPPLDQPATLVYGVRSIDFIDEFKSEKFHFACTNFMVRRPTRLFVLELLVWKGALDGHEPVLYISMEPQRVPDPILGPPADGHECLEHSGGFVKMGQGFAEAGGTHADAFVPIFKESMKRLGWDPEGFVRYRLEIEYPLAFVGLQVWIELGEKARS